MSSQRDQIIKVENGGKSDFDPLDELTIEGQQDNEDVVVKK